MKTDSTSEVKAAAGKTVAPSSGSSKQIWVAAMLGVVAFLAFLPARTFEFVRFDDPQYILENDFVKKGLSAEGFAWAWRGNLAGNWHPLTCLSHMMDCQFFGVNAGRHHVMNVLFHAINTALLFLVLRRMTKALWRSAVVAALFALHPLHVESVAWISERKDVLSAFFWLLTMWFYVRFAEFKAQGSKFKVHYIAALCCFVLGLLAKPMVVTLPCVLLLLDFWPLARVQGSKFKVQSLIAEKVPFFVLAAILSFITFAAQRSAFAGDQMPLSWRLGNAVVSYSRYLQKTFWPVDLMFLYPHPGKWPSEIVLGSAALVVSVTIVVIWLARRLPFVAIGWCWFLGTLVPVIGLVQVGLQSMADRYTYLPLIGIFIAVVWTINHVAERLRWPRPVLAVGALALLAACTVVTAQQLSFWKNSTALYHRALEASSHDKVYRAAIENPIYVNFHVSLCTDLAQAGEAQKAEAYLKDAVRVIPQSAAVRLTLGNTLAMQSKWGEAAAEFAEAARLQPKNPEAHVNLGRTLALQKKMNDALVEFSTAVKLDPNSAETHFTYGMVLEEMGRRRQAADEYREALRCRPDFAEAQQQLQRLMR